jgi:hypothetical protein
VLWVDFDGKEKEYARLDVDVSALALASHGIQRLQACSRSVCIVLQAFYNQDTFVGHAWRLRDASSGQLLAEYVGPTATITLTADGDTKVQPGLHRPPQVGRLWDMLGQPACVVCSSTTKEGSVVCRQR